MTEEQVILMKFELEKQNLLKDVAVMNQKIQLLEAEREKEKRSMSRISKVFEEGKTVNVGMLHIQYDAEKVKKITREIETIKGFVKKIAIQLEAVDEKIKVINEETLKNIKAVENSILKREEFERLDMKIIKKGE